MDNKSSKAPKFMKPVEGGGLGVCRPGTKLVLSSSWSRFELIMLYFEPEKDENGGMTIMNLYFDRLASMGESSQGPQDEIRWPYSGVKRKS